MSKAKTREATDIRQATPTRAATGLLTTVLSDVLLPRLPLTFHSLSRTTFMFSLLVTRRGPSICGAFIIVGSMSSSLTDLIGSWNGCWKTGLTTNVLLDWWLVELGWYGSFFSSIIQARDLSGWILLGWMNCAMVKDTTQCCGRSWYLKILSVKAFGKQSRKSNATLAWFIGGFECRRKLTDNT